MGLDLWLVRHRSVWTATAVLILMLPFAVVHGAGQAVAAPTGTETLTTFFVMLKSRADLGSAAAKSDRANRSRAVYEAATSNANRTQSGIRRLLADRKVAFTPYWITNSIKVTGTKQLMSELARRSDVREILPDRTYKLVEPERKAASSTAAAGWNIDRIRAPEVWSGYGDRGEGIVVGTIDTGAQFDHPAISRQYRGAATGTLSHAYSWFDPSNICGNPSTTPCDNVGHGTHVLGTVLGDADPGIGVAPAARWIAAKGCETSNCSLSALLASGQWMVAPTDAAGANPRPDLAPDIINNSWGSNVGGDPFYQDMLNTWRSAGIFATFAAGNTGPNCGTVTSPADYGTSYAVGAFAADNTIASFSARGSVDGSLIKPDIAAPGVDIRSSVPGGGYESWAGTSMASPHVTGTVALMWSAAPALRGDIPATMAVLDGSAVDTADVQCGGVPEDNSVWGQGRLDAFAAVTQSPRGAVGALTGTVTARAVVAGTAVAGAQITADGPQTRRTSTAADGTYRFGALSVGRYTVTVRAFGYLQESADVVVTEATTTTHDVALEAAARHVVSGHVRDDLGSPVAGATVRVLDTPLEAATTDVDGAYRIAEVPEAEYDLMIERRGCLLPQRVHLRVDGDETLDVVLPHRSDDAGHVCDVVTPAWVETDTTLALTGDDLSTPVSLPFPVNLYDQHYTSAYVQTNGALSFTSALPIFANQPLPSADPPNAAIYALWDDLIVGAGASVRTGLTGVAPNRRFAVEWNDVWFLAAGDASRVTFQIVLYENGRVLLQYRDIGDAPIERGASATVGIENEKGMSALMYSYNEAVLDDATAIMFRVPGAGLVRGTVTDVNDRRPVSGARVSAVQSGQPDATAITDENGLYQLRIHVGAARLAIGKENYSSAAVPVTVHREDEVVTRHAALRTARVTVNPATIDLVAPQGQRRTRPLTVRNTGSAEARWQIRESGGAGIRAVDQTARSRTERTAAYDADARDSRGLKAAGPRARDVGPLATGEVIRSWPVGGLERGWGVGLEQDNIWVSDPASLRNGSYTVDGVARGEVWPTPWAGEWGADLAYVPGRQLVCQVNVGGDNGIHCWNPRTGVVQQRITGTFPWTAVSQRGLAYRPDDDSFYIGGWNEGLIYHVKGLGHPDAGTVIGQCAAGDRSISGLSWNEAFGRLWIATNSDADRIYSVNPDTCETLGTLAPPDQIPYTGAGLETDPVGNLWMMSQGSPSTAYLIDSGLPNYTDVSWLSVTPASGSLPTAASRRLTIRVDTSGLAPGLYAATVHVLSNSGRTPTVSVPVRLVVSEYQVGINAGGKAHQDAAQDRWAADRRFVKGGYGYLATASRVVQTHRRIARTAEQPLYRDLRQGAYEYRFAAVPNGVYEVDLRFAELQQRRPNTRLFDVIVEGELRIAALDVADDAGSFTALRRTLTVVVTDGTLNIRLIDRKGGTIVNAVRVTHRPDRLG